MAPVATCANCHQRVTIPEGVDQSERVRCGLCGAEFLLREVLADATEHDDATNLPPELVPVASVRQPGQQPEGFESESDAERQPADDAETGQVEEPPQRESRAGAQTTSESRGPAAGTEEPGPETEPPADTAEGPPEETQARADEAEEPREAPVSEESSEAQEQTAEAAKETEEPTDEASEAESPERTEEPSHETREPADKDEIVRVRCPCCDAEYELSRATVVATGAPLGAAAAVLTGGGMPQTSGVSAEGAPALDIWQRPDAAPQINVGEGLEPQVAEADAGTFDFAGEESEAEDVSAGAARRKRAQKGVLRTLLGPLLGGLAGLVIAYYLLNWIRGEAGNFLKIPLPGVPHTYQHSPDWFPGWLKPASDAEDAAWDETPGSQWPETSVRFQGPAAVCHSNRLDNQA